MRTIYSNLKGKAPALFWTALMLLVFGETILLAYSSWHSKDAAQWTDEDVRQVLTDSPWSKTVRMNVLGNDDNFGTADEGSPTDRSQRPGGQSNGGTWGSGGQMPGGWGGVGHSGTGGLGGPGAGDIGRGRRNAPPVEVTVQWQSALPVRLALARREAGKTETADIQPMNEYVISISGIPGAMDRLRTNATLDDNPGAADTTPELSARLKRSASLMRNGHDPLYPIRVEVAQGNEGQTAILHFAKSDPITTAEKNVELRIALGRAELRKRFPLREMEYQGRLEL